MDELSDRIARLRDYFSHLKDDDLRNQHLGFIAELKRMPLEERKYWTSWWEKRIKELDE